jgi:hypothetical protein
VKNISFKAEVLIILIAPFLMLCGTILLDADCTAEAESKNFYYFNPDSSQSNLARLKKGNRSLPLIPHKKKLDKKRGSR